MEYFYPDKRDPQPDGSDVSLPLARRAETRNSVLLRATIMPLLDSGDICLENISRSGLRGTSNMSTVVGQFVIVSLDSSTHLSGVVRWTSDCRFGVEFETNFDSVFSLGWEQQAPNSGFRPREQRMATNRRAELIRIAPPVAGRIRNISPSGMMLETGLSFEPGRQLFVKLANGAMVDGTVRWANNSLVGLELTNRISADTFPFVAST
jgi:hypothetical protein